MHHKYAQPDEIVKIEGHKKEELFFYPYFHLRERYFNTFSSKAVGNPGIYCILDFIGKIVFFCPDIQDKIQA